MNTPPTFQGPVFFLTLILFSLNINFIEVWLFFKQWPQALHTALIYWICLPVFIVVQSKLPWQRKCVNNYKAPCKHWRLCLIYFLLLCRVRIAKQHCVVFKVLPAREFGSEELYCLFHIHVLALWVSLSLSVWFPAAVFSIFMHAFHQGRVRRRPMLFVFVFKIHTWELPGTTTVWFWCQWADPRERTGLRLGLMRFMRPSSRAFKQRLLSKVTTLLIHNACQHVQSWSRDSNWWPLVHRVQQ